MKKFLLFVLIVLTSSCSTVPNVLSFNGKKLTTSGDNLFFDPSLTELERNNLQIALTNAKKNIINFYGEMKSKMPLTIFCKSIECSEYFTGITKRSMVRSANSNIKTSYFLPTQTTMISAGYSVNQNEKIITHEISHLEFNVRLFGNRVPQWFNEGSAAFISGAPDCGNIDVSNAVNLNVIFKNQYEWSSYTDYQIVHNTKQSTVIYCESAKEVELWVKQNGKQKFINLIQSVSMGRNFYQEYGPLITVKHVNVRDLF
jgi:hypothetical protein